MRYSFFMTRSIAAILLTLTLAACGRGEIRPGITDISGVMPDLHFAMVRANDGAAITEDVYRGKIAVLYFGYTHCPDVCPATLSNLSDVLKALGPKANDVRVLFVSVDPARDTLPALRSYVTAFAPQIDGLRGTPNAIARLAQRYRVLYSVKQTPRGVEVMHSGSVFVFDAGGHAREVMTQTTDTREIAKDLRALLPR
jgi:protein SCO1/2